MALLGLVAVASVSQAERVMSVDELVGMFKTAIEQPGDNTVYRWTNAADDVINGAVAALGTERFPQFYIKAKEILGKERLNRMSEPYFIQATDAIKANLDGYLSSLETEMKTQQPPMQTRIQVEPIKEKVDAFISKFNNIISKNDPRPYYEQVRAIQELIQKAADQLKDDKKIRQFINRAKNNLGNEAAKRKDMIFTQVLRDPVMEELNQFEDKLQVMMKQRVIQPQRESTVIKLFKSINEENVQQVMELLRKDPGLIKILKERVK